MADEGFGAQLWKNVRAVKLGQDGGLELPVRANTRDGLVVGVDAIARTEAAQAAAPAEAPAESPAPARRRGWRRLFRRA